MRIGWFDVFCLFRKLCRATVAGHALLHGQSFGFFSLTMTFNAIHFYQLMMMAARQFADQAELIFCVAGLACFPIHRFGIGMIVRQHLCFNMTGGAIFALCFGLCQFWCGPESLAE